MISEAAFWGLIAASAMVIGAEVAFAFRLSDKIIGLIMAFGVGALISSVSFELVLPVLQTTSIMQTSIALLFGTFAFYVGDKLLERIDDSRRSGPDELEQKSSGFGIVLGAVLNGIPESAVLGMSMATGGGVSVALLSAIWVSNFPESLGATVELEQSGVAKRSIRLMWWGIVVISALSAAVGFAVVSYSSQKTGAFLQAFAAGTILTMIADEMAPKAYARAARATGIATSLGFVLVVLLTSID